MFKFIKLLLIGVLWILNLMPLKNSQDLCSIVFPNSKSLNFYDKRDFRYVERKSNTYVCYYTSNKECLCNFEAGFHKLLENNMYQFNISRKIRKKKIHKRQIFDPARCGGIQPPKPGKVACQISPRSITCLGTCNSGYKFVGGARQLEYFCSNEIGIWEPHKDFPPCEPECQPPCENGGNCTETNICSCPAEFRGEFCKYPIALCSLTKNLQPSSWQCNHTIDESVCDISCHPPSSKQSEVDVHRYRCNIKGEWSPALPTCVRVLECEKPPEIEHGNWKVFPGNIFSPGSRAIYSCHSGYHLQGLKQISCLENGTWSAFPPRCMQEEAPPECNDPGDIANGYRRSSFNNFPDGSSVTYICKENFSLIGNAVIFCKSNKTWFPEKPSCIPQDEMPVICSKPSAPSNSIMFVTFPEKNSESLMNSNISTVSRVYRISYDTHQEVFSSLPNLLVGTRVQYKCKSRFYKLYGSEYQTCLSSGSWSGYQAACIPECGKSDSPKTPFIVNGNSTTIGKWPWQVGLAIRGSLEQLALICGGALINELWVLTAAHCVTKRDSNDPIPIDKLLLFNGKYYRNFLKDDNHIQVRRARQIRIHENYDFIRFDSDIALVQMNSPVELTARVQPICLPTEESTRENLRDGKEGIVIGWGRKEDGKFSETLKEAILPVVSHERCEMAYQENLHSVTVTSSMFCAGYETGLYDTCSGDSGGPFMFKGSSTSINRNRWHIEGIVSWGSQSGCGKSHRYAGFTKVGKFISWINMFI